LGLFPLLRLLFPFRRRVDRSFYGRIDLDDGIASAGEELSDTGAVRARALNPEGANLPQTE
jgi:hypothetical protein